MECKCPNKMLESQISNSSLENALCPLHVPDYVTSQDNGLEEHHTNNTYDPTLRFPTWSTKKRTMVKNDGASNGLENDSKLPLKKRKYNVQSSSNTVIEKLLEEVNSPYTEKVQGNEAPPSCEITEEWNQNKGLDIDLNEISEEMEQDLIKRSLTDTYRMNYSKD